MEKILLIVPCYNEEERLNLLEFEKYSSEISFIFANDGSSDKTEEIIRDFIFDKNGMYLYNLKQNSGKAEAIRQTMNHVLDSEIYNEYKWIGFFDADLATPIWEIKNFFTYAQTYEISIDAIWGSRIYRLGSNIVRSSLRHYLGRIFATVIGTVLKIKSYDSQCGAKIFKRELCEKSFREPFLSKWIFDVELLLRLEGSNIIEYPLRSWEDIPGSKLKVGKEIFRVLFDIFKIWKKYRAK